MDGFSRKGISKQSTTVSRLFSSCLRTARHPIGPSLSRNPTSGYSRSSLVRHTCARYELFCRKLVLERHYTASAFISSSSLDGLKGTYRTPERIFQWSALQRRSLPTLLLLCETMSSTIHRLINGDARDLSFLNGESVHLAVTSPPYWNLKRYNENPDQLGHISRL